MRAMVCWCDCHATVEKQSLHTTCCHTDVTLSHQGCEGVIMQVGKEIGAGPSGGCAVERSSMRCTSLIPCLLPFKALINQQNYLLHALTWSADCTLDWQMQSFTQHKHTA